MTLNAEQAKHNNKELYNCAIQEEILAVLKQDGSDRCYRIAQKIDKPLTETRWHLEQMLKRGEVSYRLGRYGV